MQRRLIRLAAAVLTSSTVAAGAALAQPAASDAPRWVRVQLDDRVTPEQVDGLAAAGLSGLQYVPDNAFVAFGAPAALAAADAVPGVAAVEPITLADKIDPALLAGMATRRVTVLGHAAAPAPLDTVLERLGADPHVAYALGTDGLVVREATMPVRALGVLARRPDVLLVAGGTGIAQTEDEATSQVLAGSASGGYQVKPGYEQFLKRVGVTGKGVTVTIADDGLDPNHPELAGRIVRRHAHGPGPAEGHGTHVAGIAGGLGAQLPAVGRLKDADGFLHGIGVAPGVRFVDINAIAAGAQFPPAQGFGLYTRQSLMSGAAIWNASWTSGEGPGAGYVANAALLDALARDADDEKAGNQAYTFVFSAGNSGGPTSRITAPKEAKNIIAVASTVAPRAYLINPAPDDERLSSFSSRGPARDGRLLPLVAAPGENIVSARATTGTACGTAPLADGLALYSYCSGTSMASPQVTGAVALLTEWWRKRNRNASPSPAMAKAMLVNSATDIGAPDVPNTDEGWGRVNTGAMLDAAARRVYVDQKVVLTRRDQVHGVRVAPVDPKQPMRVTLAWTDAPGLAETSRTSDRDYEAYSPAALVNDLDLRVDGAGGPFLGNVLAAGRSVRGGAADRLNNLESVILHGARGAYTVSVRAHNLPGDGIPGNGRRVDQDFALVIHNARLV